MLFGDCCAWSQVLDVAVDPIVRTNDGISMEEINRLIDAGEVDNIVISPGPGSPENPADIGVWDCGMALLVHA